MDQRRIRSFSIIAHIDHGKSTLADRILQLTDAVSERERGQVLDRMDLTSASAASRSRPRRSAALKAKELHQFHLIERRATSTSHYEVSRSLQAGEGALLVVDAPQEHRNRRRSPTPTRDRERPRDRPGRQQDRPTAGRSRRGCRRGRGAARRLSHRDVLRISAKTGAGVETCSTRSSSGCRHPPAALSAGAP